MTWWPKHAYLNLLGILKYDTRVCLGTIGNVFCILLVHPIAPTRLGIEANIIWSYFTNPTSF